MSDEAAYSGVHTRYTREQIAEMQVGKTNVSRPLRLAIIALFLATILSIPFAQQVF